MANSTAYYGLMPIGPHRPQDVMWFPIDPTGTAMYHNDPVKMVADQGIETITAADTAILGAVIGIKDSNDQPALYYPGASNTGYKAGVIINQNQLYKVKCLTAATAADIGTVADIAVGTGNTTTGLSGAYIQTLETGKTANVRILGLCAQVGNAYGASQDLIVNICEHQFLLGPNGL